MGYIGVITHLLTIDPNFQRDIQVGVDAGKAKEFVPIFWGNWIATCFLRFPSWWKSTAVRNGGVHFSRWFFCQMLLTMVKSNLAGGFNPSEKY